MMSLLCRLQNTGQICCAIKRAYVHESIYDEFVSEITKAAQSAKMGDGFAADTEFGPLSALRFAEIYPHVCVLVDCGWRF